MLDSRILVERTDSMNRILKNRMNLLDPIQPVDSNESFRKRSSSSHNVSKQSYYKIAKGNKIQ